MVTSLSTGSSEGLEDLHSYQTGSYASGGRAGPTRYGAAACEEWEDYDEDYEHWEDEHDWCDGDGGFDARSLGRAASGLRSGSLSRTPGRRPPNRSQRSGGQGAAGGGAAGVGGANGGSGGRRGGR